MTHNFRAEAVQQHTEARAFVEMLQADREWLDAAFELGIDGHPLFDALLSAQRSGDDIAVQRLREQLIDAVLAHAAMMANRSARIAHDMAALFADREHACGRRFNGPRPLAVGGKASSHGSAAGREEERELLRRAGLLPAEVPSRDSARRQGANHA